MKRALSRVLAVFVVVGSAGVGMATDTMVSAVPVDPDLAVALAGSSQAVEVSEDALEVVVLTPGEVVSSQSRRDEISPFALTPDWSNTLRRQVGGLEIADMNGDGDLDLVVAVYNSNSYPPYDDWHNLIYFNTGSELETDPSWVSADQVSTGEVKVALIDGDAYPDVFAANGGFAMDASLIYYGTASGPATTAGWSENGANWTNYALLFDFDHDGDVDVVTANQGNSQFDPYRPMLMFVNHAGALETTPSWQSTESSIQNSLSWGDLDGDTWEDLAVSKWANFESGVYNADDGVLDTVPVWTTGTTDTDKGIAWADIDDNDWPDLALGHDPTQAWFNTAGSLAVGWSSTIAFFGHSDLKWCDVDRDGDPDLLEVHFSNGWANLYLNDGGVLGTTPAWTFDSPAVGTAIACGDIDGDSYPDVVVGNAGEPSIYVFLNQGSGEVFADGFESGDLSAWSGAAP